MTERQKRFADYYIESGNARRSAIRAGYSPNYAARLLKIPGVRDYAKAQLDDMHGERIASAEEVLKFLTGVMRGEESKGDVGRMKAAELLGRRLGAFTEKEEEPAEAPVIVDDVIRAGHEEKRS